MSVEEQVHPVSTDSAAPVEHLYRLSIVVPGHDHFSTEGVSSVSGREGVTGAYFVVAGRYPGPLPSSDSQSRRDEEKLDAESCGLRVAGCELKKNTKYEARNSKWFDKLTILSKVEGQIQMRIRTLLTGVTKI